jgi:hypothetical protein
LSMLLMVCTLMVCMFLQTTTTIIRLYGCVKHCVPSVAFDAPALLVLAVSPCQIPTVPLPLTCICVALPPRCQWHVFQGKLATSAADTRKAGPSMLYKPGCRPPVLEGSAG